jgi:hypothetical protein
MVCTAKRGNKRRAVFQRFKTPAGENRLQSPSPWEWPLSPSGWSVLPLDSGPGPMPKHSRWPTCRLGWTLLSRPRLACFSRAAAVCIAPALAESVRLLEILRRMKRFFVRNIEAKGRLFRGLIGLALLAGAAFTFHTSLWLAGLLALSGGFAIFEALRGWCLARACGIKTKL